MMYQIGLIMAGLIITGGILIITLALYVIGAETEREIMAEEYRQRYEEKLKR